MQHGRRGVLFDHVEWDDANLEHACRRLTAREIEQVIMNAVTYRPHPQHPERVLFDSHTDGGRRAIVVAHHDAGRLSIRPITAWEVS
jgi:hypothetical protein